IIIDIIEDSKKEALKRSAENYLKAVELAIAKENLKGEFNPNSCTIESGITKCGDKTLNVTVDGELPQSGTITLSNGTILRDSTTTLTYNDKDTLTYESGKLVLGEAKAPQVQEKYVYIWYEGPSISGPSLNSTIDPTNYSQTVPTDKDYYLKFKLNNTNTVTNSYACVKFNDSEVCIQGGNADYYGYADNENDYTGNQAIFRDSLTPDRCGPTMGGYYCMNEHNILLVNRNDGRVYAYPQNGCGYCNVYADGSSSCACY
ncbi:MAG: hypothetical protein Q4E75_06545, partial [bacterium]|nr:hypothetical protein [bacterium]